MPSLHAMEADHNQELLELLEKSREDVAFLQDLADKHLAVSTAALAVIDCIKTVKDKSEFDKRKTELNRAVDELTRTAGHGEARFETGGRRGVRDISVSGSIPGPSIQRQENDDE